MGCMHLPVVRPFRFGALVGLISAGPGNPLGKKKACGETPQAFFDSVKQEAFTS
jgi:hypothetical protein